MKRIFKKSPKSITMGIAAIAMSSPSMADTITWKDPTSGNTGWNNSANWNPNRPLATGDDVVIFPRSGGNTYSITTTAINSLTLSPYAGITPRNVNLTGAILNVGAGGISNQLDDKNGILTISEGVRLNAAQIWTATGQIVVAKAVTQADASATLTVQGQRSVVFNENSTGWSSGLNVRGTVAMGAVAVASGGSIITPWGTGRITLTTVGAPSVISPKLEFGSTATAADAATLTNNFVLANEASSTGNFYFEASSSATSSAPRYNLTGSISDATVGAARGLYFQSASGKNGTFVLSGESTHQVRTEVGTGTTLLINGQHTNAADYHIQSGATLGGTGRISSGRFSLDGEGNRWANVVLEGGAKLSPGDIAVDGGIGTFTLNLKTNESDRSGGILDISAAVSGAHTGALIFRLAGLGINDKVVLEADTVLKIGIGQLNFDDFAFSIRDGSSIGIGVYTLFSSNTAIDGTLGGFLSGMIGGYQAEIAFDNNNQNLILSVIPEPGTRSLLAGALGLTILLCRAPRRNC